MTDRRGECEDPAAASGLLHTLRAGRLAASMLAPAEPRWSQLRCTAAPGLDLRDRFRGALNGGAIGDAMGRPNEGVSPFLVHPGRPLLRTCARQVQPSDPSLGSRGASSDMERA